MGCWLTTIRQRWLGKGKKMYTIPKNLWKPAKSYDGRLTAIVNCPKCDARCALNNHQIAPNGDVSPSVVCPSPACNFHEFVTLNEWNADE